MGGRCAYKLACFLPITFAAAAICCGRAGVWNEPDRLIYNLEAMKGLPVWIIHGLSDTTVDPDHALAALRALRAIDAKGSQRLTMYPAVGHNCYDFAFLDSELYSFLEGFSLK